jgi:hypothetical protein
MKRKATGGEEKTGESEDAKTSNRNGEASQ